MLGIGEAPADDGDDRVAARPARRRTAGSWAASTDTLEAARERHEASRAELPAAAHRLQRGEPAIPTLFEDNLT